MHSLSDKRCIIGEGPIWNERTGLLYYTNGFGNEICIFNPENGCLQVRPVTEGVAAFAFDTEDRLIVSRADGVFILNEDDTVKPLYDTKKYPILYGNDMKVGPDGRIYVGTLSERKKGISSKHDGKLYRIDREGRVEVLLDGLIIPNGMEWSMDEKRFYFTDNATGYIREYDFVRETGEITPTGREILVKGVDGFTIDKNDDLYITRWGLGDIAVVDTKEMKIRRCIPVPTKSPASCAFAGPGMQDLVVVTASYQVDLTVDPSAGLTFIERLDTCGRVPYRFGAEPAK